MRRTLSMQLIAVAVTFLFALGGSGCDGGKGPETDDPDPPPFVPDDGPDDNEIERIPSGPDLRVSAIRVTPQSPKAGQPFSLTIYVANKGDKVSGQYNLYVTLKWVGSSTTAPWTGPKCDPLQPGDDAAVYTRTDRVVDDPGSYQIHAQIKPIGWSDIGPENNSKIWAFQVQ